MWQYYYTGNDPDEEWCTKAVSQNPMYPHDAREACAWVRDVLCLHTAMISGGRTPNPYADTESFSLSIVGTSDPTDFLGSIKTAIESGPGPESVAAIRQLHDITRLTPEQAQELMEQLKEHLTNGG